MEIKVITDLTAEPVLKADMKNRLKATYGTDTTEDAEIESQIKAARQLIERHCGLSLGTKTIEIFYHADEVLAKRVRLPYGPHDEMTSVKRLDQEGDETAMTLNTDYYKRGTQFWELEFLTSTVNPWSEGSVTDDDYKIRLTVGYGGENTETLPEVFEQAIKAQVLRWYRHEYDGQLSQEVKRMLSAYTMNVWI